MQLVKGGGGAKILSLRHNEKEPSQYNKVTIQIFCKLRIVHQHVKPKSTFYYLNPELQMHRTK